MKWDELEIKVGDHKYPLSYEWSRWRLFFGKGARLSLLQGFSMSVVFNRIWNIKNGVNWSIKNSSISPR